MKKIRQEVITRIHELKGQGYSQSQVAKELRGVVSQRSIASYWNTTANVTASDTTANGKGCYYWQTYKTCFFTKHRKIPPIGDTTSWRPPKQIKVVL